MATIPACFVSNDILIVVVLTHISYQFKVLQNFLKHMVEISYKQMIEDGDMDNSKTDMDTSTIPWKYLHKALQTAVGYHTAILDIASEMESTFSKLLLVAVLDTLILICVSIYHASTVRNSGQQHA
ncbi:hypothetical protein ILUMI_11631, partial [Ignelater luminosus]